VTTWRPRARCAWPLADVEAAQKEIVAIARRMAENGDIVLSSGGEEFL